MWYDLKQPGPSNDRIPSNDPNVVLAGEGVRCRSPYGAFCPWSRLYFVD